MHIRINVDFLHHTACLPQHCYLITGSPLDTSKGAQRHRKSLKISKGETKPEITGRRCTINRIETPPRVVPPRHSARLAELVRQEEAEKLQNNGPAHRTRSYTVSQ